MAYATQTDLEQSAGGAARLVDLADYDKNGVADAAVVARAISEAEELVDGYARRLRDLLPFNPVPKKIKYLVADEAVYWLKQKRGVATDDDRVAKTERELLLERMAQGKWNPVEGDTYPLETGGGTPTVVEHTEVTRPFGRAAMKRYF